ncbi:uncharacterized protein LOC144927972 [Branchiostoma floridae x Branchiostoma belcheri]
MGVCHPAGLMKEGPPQLQQCSVLQSSPCHLEVSGVSEVLLGAVPRAPARGPGPPINQQFGKGAAGGGSCVAVQQRCLLITYTTSSSTSTTPITVPIMMIATCGDLSFTVPFG